MTTRKLEDLPSIVGVVLPLWSVARETGISGRQPRLHEIFDAIDGINVVPNDGSVYLVTWMII